MRNRAIFSDAHPHGTAAADSAIWFAAVLELFTATPVEQFPSEDKENRSVGTQSHPMTFFFC